MKKIDIGWIADKINGITVSTKKPCNPGNYAARTSRSVQYVVMHYTGNSKDTAKNNANYFQTAGRGASAHIFVDDTEIWQSVELRHEAWHCGTRGNYYHSKCRSANSIGIEMCCTAGNYKISETTKKNAAHVCAYLCKLIGISAAEVDTYVLRHYDVTHKDCPAQMAGAKNSEWEAFKDLVRDILETGSAPAEKKPTASTSTAPAFEVGDAVEFTGRKHYGSSDASTGTTCKPGKAKVTATKKGAKHPYHLVAINGGGSTVYGWVNAAAVKALETATSTGDTDRAKYRDAALEGTYRTTAPLNMRTGAGTGKKVKLTIPEGASVQCYGYYNKDSSGTKWLYVDYKGKSGYCSSKYLKK